MNRRAHHYDAQSCRAVTVTPRESDRVLHPDTTPCYGECGVTDRDALAVASSTVNTPSDRERLLQLRLPPIPRNKQSDRCSPGGHADNLLVPVKSQNAATSSGTDEPVAWQRALAWVVGATLLRALLGTLVPLLPDETYYWVWSRHLDAGYFDHPPAVAWLIAMGTTLFGDTSLGVRAGPAVAATVTHLGVVTAAWQIAGRGVEGGRAAVRAATLVAVSPLAVFGLVMATPDATLFAAAMIALVALERALAAPLKSRRALGMFTLSGASVGVGLLSKYTAVLMPVGLLFACIVHPALRIRLREIGPWWAGIVGAVVFTPVILWNAFHQWVSFHFQWNHGFSSAAKGALLANELKLAGGQLGLATPVLFGLMALAVGDALRDGWRSRFVAAPTAPSTRRFALAMVSIVPFMFFAISATQRPVEANWPALGYPAAMVLLASDTSRRARGPWWRGGVLFAAAVVAVFTIQAWRPVLPVSSRKDPIARAHGWNALAEAVARARKDPFLDGTVDRWIAADRYQEASSLWFYLPDHPTVFSLNIRGRSNQFDLWPTAFDKLRPGDGLVAVFDDNAAGDALGRQVSTWFRESRRDEQVMLRRADGVFAHRRVWLYRIATNVPTRASMHPSLSGQP